MATPARQYGDLVRSAFGGRRFLLFGGPTAGLVGLSAQLRGVGAAGCLLLGNGPGVGPRPAPEDACCELPALGADMLDAMRAHEARVASPPEDARRAIDAFDPDGSALALAPIVLGPIEAVAGRRLYARRRPEWAALEDKLAVDALWDEAGVPRAPSAIVPARPGAIEEAAGRLGGGAVAVAGDAAQGLHGGASLVRCVFDAASLDEAAAYLGARCRRVRVMPFLEGIPCSIHALVAPDGVAVFRPVEMVTLRRPADGRLAYAGFGTWWDPPAAAREEMRAAARRVAALLRRRVGYRGVFTMDGVLTDAGFRPTELNPRVGAALGTLAQALPEVELLLLALAVAEGDVRHVHPAELEARVVEAADARRGGRAHLVLPGVSCEERHVLLVERGADLVPAPDGATPVGVLGAGPSGSGVFVHFTPAQGAVAEGPSFAPLAARALRAAGELFGLPIGPLLPARPAAPAR